MYKNSTRILQKIHKKKINIIEFQKPQKWVKISPLSLSLSLSLLPPPSVRQQKYKAGRHDPDQPILTRESTRSIAKANAKNTKKGIPAQNGFLILTLDIGVHEPHKKPFLMLMYIIIII